MGTIMPVQDKIWVIGMVMGLSLITLLLTFISQPTPKQDHSPHHYTPQFHHKECFVSNRMPREPWLPPVDGIVEMVGYAHYFVMYYAEANRKYAGDKVGWQEEMQEFDRKYHVITCPPSWGHKEGKKR